MNINELEQSLRNLVAAEPRVLSGQMGGVVRSMLNITEAYRNFMYQVQNYPANDVFRFSMLKESQRLEADIAGMAQAMFNERGFNLMLYLPQNMNFGGMDMGGANTQYGQMQYNSNLIQPNYYNENMQSETAELNNFSSSASGVKEPIKRKTKTEKENMENFKNEEPSGKPSFGGEETDSENDKSTKVTDSDKPDDTGEDTSNRNYLAELLKK